MMFLTGIFCSVVTVYLLYVLIEKKLSKREKLIMYMGIAIMLFILSVNARPL